MGFKSRNWLTETFVKLQNKSFYNFWNPDPMKIKDKIYGRKLLDFGVEIVIVTSETLIWILNDCFVFQQSHLFCEETNVQTYVDLD